MLALAVAVAVSLISAGTLALHGSRSSRWDAPLTVGIGSLLLGLGTFEHVIAATTALNEAEPGSAETTMWTLASLRWAGLCLIVGGLVWRGQTGWSTRVRVALISVALAAPAVVAISWTAAGETNTSTERAVQLVLAGMLVVTSLRLVQRESAAPFFEGGTVLGLGLALAIILQASSVEPGDVASVACAGLAASSWPLDSTVVRTPGGAPAGEPPFPDRALHPAHRRNSQRDPRGRVGPVGPCATTAPRR